MTPSASRLEATRWRGDRCVPLITSSGIPEHDKRRRVAQTCSLLSFSACISWHVCSDGGEGACQLGRARARLLDPINLVEECRPARSPDRSNAIIGVCGKEVDTKWTRNRTLQPICCDSVQCGLQYGDGSDIRTGGTGAEGAGGSRAGAGVRRSSYCRSWCSLAV